MTPRSLLKMLSTGIAIAMLGSQGAAQTKPTSPNTDPKALATPFSLRAFAVNMSNIGPGSAGVIDFKVDRWSTAEERQKIITTMVEQGPNKLLDLLQDLPAKGRMRFPNYMGPDPNNWRLGWDIKYTWTTPLPEGGHRVVLGLDRYMSFAEVRNQPRTVDYPFTLIEIHLDKEGKGQGKMAYATKITFDKKKNTVELENYSSEPVRLNEVTLEKG
jgi:hypothetical protein